MSSTLSIQGSKLQTFRAGESHFALPIDCVQSTTDWQKPARLPHAPSAVLGIVGIRGHILTVLDPAILLGQKENPDYSCGSLVVLRGDEQLALAVSEIGPVTEASQNVEPSSNKPLVRGLLNRDGKTVSILNEKELFATALLGRERRRRRF